ncbi:MAG: hypothetical protein JNK15_20690 [Planctomycetes bacterium]|nr:hypothetical protein [Planctomycetota bacterium]
MRTGGWRNLLRPGGADDFFAAAPTRPLAAADRAGDVDAAWWCSELARLAYRDPDAKGRARAAFLADVGLRELGSVDRAGTHCLIVGPAAGAPFVVAAFRGTDEVRDWLTNFQAVPARWSAGGYVHRGFRNAFHDVLEALQDDLGKHAAVPLHLCGHSLGGALALLAATVFGACTVRTFGAPRVGDAAFAATLHGIDVAQFATEHDLVPHLPPSGTPLHFQHVQVPVVLRGDGGLETWGAVGGESEPAGRDRRWYAPPTRLAEHAPLVYSERLRRLCGGT